MPLTDDNSTEYWGNSDPKCPHCDFIYDIGNNDAYQLYQEDNHSIECPNCNADYSVYSRPLGWAFDTDEQD